jgi:hypothetical protein
MRENQKLSRVKNKLDDHLQRSLGPTTSIDPAMQALIDKRFRTLVTHELSKRFGVELHQVTNLGNHQSAFNAEKNPGVDNNI